MPEPFRSLASMLLARDCAHAEETQPAPPAEPDDVQGAGWTTECDVAELVRDVRLFHARVREAVESASGALLADIAAGVLGRELQLAPCDLQAILAGALSRFATEDPVRVRVHPEDAAGMSWCGIPVLADARLRRGDAVIELRNGSLDASLGVRLASVLAAC